MLQFDKIDYLIKQTLAVCESWIELDEDDMMLRLIDPIDRKEISGHYGATHAAVAFIILGKSRGDGALLDKGKNLLSSIIVKWDKSKSLPDFHSDFNNFALSVAHDYLKDNDPALCKDIISKVCSTNDSNHNTVNWLPMRWYVNKKRYEWTGDEKFKKKCHECESLIIQATNEDGGIEDIIPKGKSFNLQYNIATVATIQFMRCRGLDFDLSKELGFLIKSVAPDGDINYQGRGTNQVFAWGMWLYLLLSSENETEVKNALSFIFEKIPKMLESNNIMLNSWKGEEKYLWWDYHYCSVYTAHFLFWLILSIEDYQKKPIQIKESEKSETGILVKKTSEYFISTFNGRNQYLAEKGPIISALWLKKYGMVSKGTFGPWQGHFGNKYSFGDVVMRNYIGLLKINQNRNWSSNRIIKKIWLSSSFKYYMSIIPICSNFEVKDDIFGITIKFDNQKRESVFLNFPVLDTITETPSISLHVDGEPMEVINNIRMRTQYGWCKIFQSKISSAQDWILRIE